MKSRMRHIAILLAICTTAACFPQAAPAQSPKDQAWSVLYTGLADGNVPKRTTAVQVLGLLPGDCQSQGSRA